MKKVAVAVLNWNGRDLLKRFIPDLIKYSPEATIYVIDNASTDDSVTLLKTVFPSVKCIQLSSNLGYAGGYNLGLKQINEEILVLLNSDVAVTPNWLLAFLRRFYEDERVGILQPKIKDLKNPTYFEYAGAAGGYIDLLGYPFCKGRIFNTLEKDEGQYNSNYPIFWASGACLVVRNNLFKRLGGFDEDYFAHQEEIDFCWRAQLQGFLVEYCYQSEVYHLGGATLASANPKKTFLNFRNSLYNLLKNQSLPQALITIFIRMILDGLAGIQFLIKGKINHFKAILQAHFSFYKNFNHINKKRKTIRHTQQVKPSNFSIVYKYFVQKKKKFNQL
ncbi:glycosyltransferase family 2 protein [uncultured Mesonia sp.]|uniref:glycosyltransferase family 2 protein n=1 Tax=uncultured Mesonia sp. TaxID=399731 RepID=UPI00374F78A5